MGKLAKRRRKLAMDMIARSGREHATRIYDFVETLPKKSIVAMEGLSGVALGDYGTSGDPELSGYTRLTGFGKAGKVLRDLTPWSQEQMLKISHFLYTQNPGAMPLIDRPVDLAIGAELGFTVEFDAGKLKIPEKKARDLAADAKDVLDRFWDHPAHSLRWRAAEYITTFKVSGELCLPLVTSNEVDGVPQLDYLDSMLISDVLPLEQSSMVPGIVMVRPKGGVGTATAKTIVRYNTETERLEGECFYWRNSRILNAMRGRSDLLNVADYLDSLDQLLFSQIDRAILLNNVVWQLKLEGANEPQITEAVKKLRAELGKPGGVFGHNEKGELNAVSPQLGSYETAALGRLIGNHIRSARGMPESWGADGGETNRATAGEQTDVGYKALVALQSMAKNIFGTLLAYAYDNLAELQEGAGFPKRSTGAVILSVDLPPVRERDMGRSAQALTAVEAGLEGAVNTELLSRKTSRKVLVSVVEKVTDLAIDADDEAAEIEAEVAERETADAKRAEMMARKGLASALDRGGAPDEGGGNPPTPSGNGGAATKLS